MIFLVLIILVLGGCATEYNPATGRQELIFISSSQEVNLGRRLSKKVEEEFKLCKDPQYLERLYKVAERLVKVQSREDIVYHFDILDKDDINAFTLPGGYIYVFKGLMEFIKSDDELAFVLGHEIAHNVAKHAIKKLQGYLGSQLLLVLSTQAKSAGFIQGMELALRSIFSSYSREDEFLADKLGVQYAKEAGYNPCASIEFLMRLHSYQMKQPSKSISYFRTHPYIPQRISALKKELGLPLDLSDFMNK